MAFLEINSRRLELNKDGFLAVPDEWDEDVARGFAKIEGIQLTDEYWKLIVYSRKYWQKFGSVPLIAKLCKETDTNTDRFFELFPNGSLKIICKIAGLPKPKGCI